MKKKISKKRAIISMVLIGILVAALGIGNYYAVKYEPIITAYLGHKSYEVKDSGTEEDTEYYKATFSSEEERLAADAQAARTAAAEGCVLLKNEDQALPLSGDNKVT